jgi:CHASE3 domain sensor protein
MNASVTSLKGLAVLLRRGHLHSIGTPTLIAAAVLLICALLLLGANVSALSDSFAWVQRTDNALMALSDIELRVIGNELTIRGYALTDDPRFLLFHGNETKFMWAATDKLGDAIGYDPVQVARYRRLRAVLDQRSNQLSRLFSLGPGHAREVAAAIVDDRYRNVLFAARGQVDDFRAEELKLLAERQAAATLQAKRTYGIAIAIFVLAFAFGGLGIAFEMFGRARAVSVRPAPQRVLARGS